MPPFPQELAGKVRAIREDVVMSTLAVGTIAASVLFLGNMVRNLALGNPLSLVHSLLFLCLITVYLMRMRIGVQRIAWLIVILLYVAGTAGLILYGLAGNSAAVYMALCFVSTSFFGLRGGLFAAALSVASVALVGILLTLGFVTQRFDAVAFLHNPFSWLASILTLASMTGLVLTQLGRLNDRHMRLLHDQHHLARHDSLTGLANRMAAETILEHSIADALRAERSLAVLVLDLDRFKTINDSLGHEIGDRLLIEVAIRLRGCVRASDTVARLGGDEFVLLLSHLSLPDDATQIAAKLVESLSRVYVLEGHELYTSPSIGISLCPQDARDVSKLIKYADIAMYVAKAQGGARFHYFSPEMNEAVLDRLNTENQLREAIRLDGLAVHYQPKVDLNGTLTGVEALVRWKSTEAGLQAPACFISVAEESDLINEIGEWVLREVCRQIRAWIDGGLEPPRVAVNLSARQLTQTTLADTVSQIVRQYGLEPRHLEFEMTESVAMRDPDNATLMLGELGAMGIRLSIDDFGTGYSSLARLRSLPLDALKIDHTFIRDITIDGNDLAIAQGTIALAHSLGLKVIAEGVETIEQWKLLVDSGCDEMQGYLIARPAPADDLAETIRTRRCAPKQLGAVAPLESSRDT
jgi:diguanylate cyclase (GGDEF)-like protein